MKRIIIITYLLAFFSSSSFCQWEKLYFPGGTPYTLLETSQGLLAANSHVIYKSTNNGISWDSLSSISSLGISKIFQIGDVLLTNTSRAVIWPNLIPSVFRSDDFGQSWYSVLDGILGGSSIAFCNSKTYVDLDGNLYCSRDTGRTWNILNTDSIFPGNVSEIISDGNSLYVRIQAEALYGSSDNALTWDSLKTNFSNNFFDVLVQDSCVYVGTFSNGFYISRDKGNNWHNASIGLPDSAGTRALSLYSNNIIASISKDFQQSIYRYNLGDNKWHSFNEGFSLKRTGYIYDFVNNSEYIFLASDSSIWRRPLSDLITDVAQFNNQLITDAILFQNYPNPFNPSTTIEFKIAKPGQVKIVVYDLLGREVGTILNEYKNTGNYKVTFVTDNLSSGIYYYRLISGNNIRTKSMILLK
ncbi:MAG: T9SS type A sorting domain-containing protein [Ignavibacteria bacterium]|jgi:hypothetical protein